MICPNCKKQNNTKEVSIDFISEINSFKRTRKCDCGNKFVTFEVASDQLINELNFKFPSVTKRKVSKKTAWQDWRFLCYVREHYATVVFEIRKILKKKDLEKNYKKVILGAKNLVKKYEEGILEVNVKTNSRGKICYQFKDIKTNKEFEVLGSNIKIRSIRKVLKNPKYWENRKLHFNIQGDPTEQEKEHEETQFIKSLNHKKTGIRSNKYNLHFFKRDNYFYDRYIGPDEKNFWFNWKNMR